MTRTELILEVAKSIQKVTQPHANWEQFEQQSHKIWILEAEAAIATLSNINEKLSKAS